MQLPRIRDDTYETRIYLEFWEQIIYDISQSEVLAVICKQWLIIGRFKLVILAQHSKKQ